MKIRIKGNSVRYRLSKTDVDTLTATGYLQEQTSFGVTVLKYALQRKEDAIALSADYKDNMITTYIPASFLQGWDKNDVIGIDFTMPLGEGETLYLLIEKDFKCLDDTTEDQSDNYDNPNQTC